MSTPFVKWIVETADGGREEFETRPQAIVAGATLIRCEYWPPEEEARPSALCSALLQEMRAARKALGEFDYPSKPLSTCVADLLASQLEQKQRAQKYQQKAVVEAEQAILAFRALAELKKKLGHLSE